MDTSHLKGFVYIWWEISTGKYYIGSHLGTPTDGYICSSQLILNKIQTNRQDWHRERVLEGQLKYVRTTEKEIIAACLDDDLCYNQAIEAGSRIVFKDIDLTIDTVSEEARNILQILGEQDERQ